ncbi:MAG: penicillin acylase family protein [bacterium]|nr:penicillin acylase family protein [bacterium]
MPAKLTQSALEAALPDLTSTLQLSGLNAPVTIYRDAWGIPHIKAQNEHDLFFAQGFATAQDRLWHMDYDRHRALGRWAEFAGPGAIPQDRLLRATGMGRTAKLDYEAASHEAKSMVDAYTAGVNAFLQTTQSLPIEYTLLDEQPEPWENWHCIAAYKMRNTLLGTYEPKLFRTRLALLADPEKTAALLKGYPEGSLLTVPPGEPYHGPPLDGLNELARAKDEAAWLRETDPGSNAWSISGKSTQSGLPLMGGDSHRALDTPSVYYQVHLSCPDFTVTGSSVPGMPGALHFCHNEHVGWGMTYGNADTQDLFLERFREGKNGREYEFQGQWKSADVLNETLQIRGGDPIKMEVTITHHGPIIVGNPASGTGIAISDPGLLTGTLWLDAARDAIRATSVAELHHAFRNWTDRVNNYAVVDTQGNFGYLHEGKIPIRTESNGWRAVPGWTGEHEWQGYIPHNELPSAINPNVGYAITCNQRVAGHNYPYYVGLYFSPDYRTRRIQQHILDLAPGSATVEHMTHIHADRTSIPAPNFVNALLSIPSPNEASQQALNLLKTWDYRMDRDLVQPTLYAQTRLVLARRLVEHMLGNLAEEALHAFPGTDHHVRLIVQEADLALARNDASILPPGQTWPGILSDALSQAITELHKTLGEDMTTWTWGRVHRTRPQHPLSATFPEAASLLDPPDLPVHGDGDVPLAGSYRISDPFIATGLSVNRYIHDPSNWNNSRWIVPLGASGHPGSPHYADQARLWANVEYVPQLWDWTQIASESETQQHLEPAS